MPDSPATNTSRASVVVSATNASRREAPGPSVVRPHIHERIVSEPTRVFAHVPRG